jgi:signal transduction histidine kinase
MVLRRAARKPVITTLVSAVLIISVVVVFSENRIQSETRNIENAKANLNKAIAGRTELRIHDAQDIIEIAARLPAMQNPPDPSLISTELKGIPADADTARRQVLRTIYDEYDNFESVAFLMPNGDVYAVEPAALQQNLTRINFADREYYKGVTSTNKTYISEVFRSTATNHNTVVIASPVFISGSLGGIMVGALDLQAISDGLHQLELLKNELVLIVDGNGNQIASSNPDTSVNELQSFSHLTSFGKAIAGESGISSERLDGILMNVAYSPIDVGSKRWALLLIQPYNDAYSQAISSQNESIIIVALVLGIISASGYLIFRALVENAKLNDRLEDANAGLKDLNKELQSEKNRLEHLSAELEVQSEKLREMDKMKEEFSAMITHELKTPLVPIIGYSELLMDGTLGDLTPKQKEKIQLVHENGLALSRLISDLLDVRKLELGQMKFEMRDTSPLEVVQQSVNTVIPMSRAKNVTLIFDKDQQANPSVRCDPKRIQQVLHNLLTNAIKFVPENTGRIQVSIKPSDDGNSVLFVIRDNGIGIQKEKQQNLFKKFYQVDTSLSRNAGGTGLGLAISKGIVEAHNGKIWVESELGVGATFYFTIPRSKSELATTRESR